ncbi:Sortase family protein [Streptomyces sp. YIM 121038]|uniref:class F sortase n=1 Tax=Streptomyces sp. YIM 121038 TaxID=2136401 RepID=UPI001161D636|nr:class F sortase [Streptomyces sp. YIM 121038]QCX74892.1 Sortase family protein [Streptomyces sp. YIM 121038]
MPLKSRPLPRRAFGVCVLAVAVGAAVGGCSAADGTAAATKERPSASRTYDVGTPGAAASQAPAAPVHVAIPSIGVRSPLLRLGLNPDRTVEVPPAEKGMTAGWYTGGAIPGRRGAAVIIGHNDTRFGRAVFHDLKKVRVGADIAVRDARGRTVHFRVTATETAAKKAFPTDKVYGATDARALRLITCDGAYDAQGHPVDNLIVYATANR